MAQAALDHGIVFDLLSLFQDLLSGPDVDVLGRPFPKALVVAVVVVVVDEGADLALEITGQEVLLQRDTVLHGLVPSLDLALGLWVIGCATNMLHTGRVARIASNSERALPETEFRRCVQHDPSSGTSGSRHR